MAWNCPLLQRINYCNGFLFFSIINVCLVGRSSLIRFLFLAFQESEDAIHTIPQDRTLKSVTFQDTVNVISGSPAVMELESQQIQHGCLKSQHAAGMQEAPEGAAVQVRFLCCSKKTGLLLEDVAFSQRTPCLQEICYLDQVLDAASGSSCVSEHPGSICIERKAPSVCVSASPPAGRPPVLVQGQRPTTLLTREDAARRSNGHAQSEDSACGAAKFELRAFQEERRPVKLFSPGEEQQVRVTRRRPTEEVLRRCFVTDPTSLGLFEPSCCGLFLPSGSGAGARAPGVNQGAGGQEEPGDRPALVEASSGGSLASHGCHFCLCL